MAMTSVWLNVDERDLGPALREAGEKLDGAEGEVVLDFSTVRRIDAGALQTMSELAGAARNRDVKVVLRGVNVDVYKVLKLMRLAGRFAFAA
jgi:anti-anti-sigma regulatory factor